LTKILKSEEANQVFFDFLLHSIISLENLANHVENFHLQFLIRASGLLGFFITEPQEIGKQLQHAGYLFDYKHYATCLHQLIEADYGTPIPMNHQERREILDALIKFYQLHFEGFGEIKSLSVLKEVF
jgi:DNA repair protein RecO (recombination protein O)